MRIVYIYDGDWPRGATRVRKQTRALAAAGHDVLLLSRNENRSARVEHEDWMEVRRLPTVPGRLANRLFNFPYFLNPAWWRHIHSNARDWKADAILVEDLPLAPTALWVGRSLDLPVYYDMGEVYPEFLRGLRQFQERTLIDTILRSPRAADALERYVLPRVKHVFVVSEESRDRALARGASPRATTIVGNTPESSAELRSPQDPPSVIQDLLGRPLVLFTGILISDRGMIQAVQAIDMVRDRIPDVALVIVGDGAELPAIRAEISRLGLGDHVRIAGWQDHSQLPAFYQHADVGILPFLDGGQIRYTLANKLFDYMGARLPVIASDVPPMRRVLHETGAGLLSAAGDPRSLADALVEFFSLTREERAQLGERGHVAVAELYNWNHDAQRLVAAFQSDRSIAVDSADQAFLHETGITT